MSDQEQFGVPDHWMPPEEFERVRQGDCDDFSLWTWRQLLALGYRARFVYGLSGRYGSGHAWVTFEANGEWYLVEPLLARAGQTIPRLLERWYKPYISVEVRGKEVKYLEHIDTPAAISFVEVAGLVPELSAFSLKWILAWGRWGAVKLVRMPGAALRFSRRFMTR